MCQKANQREEALPLLTFLPSEKYHFSLHKQAFRDTLCLKTAFALIHTVSSRTCVDLDPLSCPPSPSDYPEALSGPAFRMTFRLRFVLCMAS